MALSAHANKVVNLPLLYLIVPNQMMFSGHKQLANGGMKESDYPFSLPVNLNLSSTWWPYLPLFDLYKEDLIM